MILYEMVLLKMQNVNVVISYLFPLLPSAIVFHLKKVGQSLKVATSKLFLPFAQPQWENCFLKEDFVPENKLKSKLFIQMKKIFTSPFSSLFPLSIFSSSSWIYIFKKFSKAGNVVASWWKPPKSSALNDQEPPFLHQDWGSPYLKMKCLALHDFTIFLKIISFLLQTHICT